VAGVTALPFRAVVRRVRERWAPVGQAVGALHATDWPQRVAAPVGWDY